MTAKPRLAIFARAPVLGRVKTRLARSVGEEAALAAYRDLLGVTLERLAPGVGRFVPEIWVEGDPSAFPSLPDLRVVAQPPGDLGERMAAAFEDGVSVLVGTDIPFISADYVERALDALTRADLVLGPTEDGGYCLVAMTTPQGQVFEGIPWSTPDVLATTLAAAEGLSVELLEPLWDVDDAAGLARWRGLSGD